MSSGSNVARASAGMAVGTVLSRLTGFGRLLLVAATIGTALNADLFNNANTVPNASSYTITNTSSYPYTYTSSYAPSHPSSYASSYASSHPCSYASSHPQPHPGSHAIPNSLHPL